MLKVNRSNVSYPEWLRSPQAANAQSFLAKFYSSDPEYRATRRAPFEELPRPQVKEALEELFHGKCAYCESDIRGSGSEIDHFRPKAAASNLKGDKQNADHYGWFLYEWSNHFLSCLSCNRAKRNLFPVDGPRAPVLSSWIEACRSETALLLDPCLDTPERHLRFDLKGVAFGRTKRGKATIDVLNLNRENLVAARREKFEHCAELLEVLRQGGKYIADTLMKELDDASAYSGAARIFLYQTYSKYMRAEGRRSPAFYSFLTQELWRDTRLFGETRVLDALEEKGISATGIVQVIHDKEEPVLPSLKTAGAFKDIRGSSAVSMICRVEISDFKDIQRLDLKFQISDSEKGQGCAMLIGENSVGKSSVLQAIALCLMGEELRDMLKINAEDFIAREIEGWKHTRTKDAVVKVEFTSGDIVTLVIPCAGPWFDGSDEPSGVVLGYGARRYFDDKRKQSATHFGLRTLFEPSATISHPERWLQRQDEKTFNAVARAMRDILLLQPDDEIHRDEEGRIYVTAHQRMTPIDRLSDGYKSLFAMAVDIMREMVSVWGNLEFARGVVLIDEVETHLHPRWKMQVINALRSAMPQVQFIATTHDPLCLRGMRDGEVKVLFRDEDKVIQTLEGLPKLSSLRAEQLLTSDYFGLVSTSDPVVEAELEEYALLSSGATLTPDRQARLDELSISTATLTVIGDTPGQQIVSEAYREYLIERGTVDAAKRNELRRDAVEDVLRALRARKTNAQG